MTGQSFNLMLLLPEILLLIGICVLLLSDAGNAQRRFGSTTRALLVLALALLALIPQPSTTTETAFGGMVIADSLSRLLKLCAVIAVGASLVLSSRYCDDREVARGEFQSLALLSLLGQFVMISANHLLVVYLGLELMSLSLYALAALRRDSGLSSEAAIKYFVLGALASGFLLYGMSMIYGGAGTLAIDDIAGRLVSGEVDTWVFALGLVFIVAGLAFKFGAVPFHMWIPDVYQGTPTAMTLLIAGAPKLAGFAIAFRLLAEGMLGAWADWQPMLLVLAVASLVVGNVAAIAQQNLKRMLAYSTISQVGFVLLGMLSGVVDGDAAGAADAWGSSLFYIVTYVFTTVGTFGVIMLLSRAGFEAESLDDLRGLNQRSPWIALVMLLLMFSLAGIPPMVGFYAKFIIIGSVVSAGMTWLAVFAVMLSLVAAFYYLRVVKLMYFDTPADAVPVAPSTSAALVLAVNGALVFVLGLLPGPLIGACLDAVRQALGS
jgi:NADH-quinone oxidoreductase subunit N